MQFCNKLINWYLNNKRDLPWRKTTDPYFIWLSEIILQQTKIDQGLPYYNAFVTTFPTIFDLANATEEKVLKLWQGLGYYSRARNLHHTAQFIAENNNGVFPVTYKELLALKGVGDYTASAIASISFNTPQAVVDGNVYRVLARVFGVSLPINSSKGITYFKTLAQKVMDKKNPATYNQAIMEFGALWCKPKNPNCISCIFQDTCYAFANKKVEMLPVKTAKTKVRKRYFNYLVFLSSDKKTILNRREGNGIWKNLYEFPLIETSENTLITALHLESLKGLPTIDSFSIYNEVPILHKLSHQHLHITFWIATAPSIEEGGISFSEIEKLPVPIVLHNFITAFSF